MTDADPAIDPAAAPTAPAPTAPAPTAPAPPAEELAAQAAAAPPATAEELSALATAAATAVPIAPTPAQPTETADAGPGTDAAKPTRTRRRRLGGWLRKLVTSLLALAMFVVGVAFGGAVYGRLQPPPVAVGDPSTGGIVTPAVVQELAAAIESNDGDAMRSAVSGEPYGLLTGEMQRWDIGDVTAVETLATMQNGTRSATELVIVGKASSGDPVVFNLVVQVDDNQIVGFR